jgi:hypothetical protein
MSRAAGSREVAQLRYQSHGGRELLQYGQSFRFGEQSVDAVGGMMPNRFAAGSCASKWFE